MVNQPPEKSDIKRPRMRLGKCINELNPSEVLPKEDCLSKSGKGLPRSMRERNVKVVGNKECVWVDPITYTRSAQTVTKEPYIRKAKQLTQTRCRCPKKEGKTSCTEADKVCKTIPVTLTEKTITTNPIHLTEKPIDRKGRWQCSEGGLAKKEE